MTILADDLVVIDAAGPLALVPSEAVLLLAADLPAGAAQRRAALPFAVEDALAEPLEAMHIVCGAPLGGGRWLVAAAAHDRMATWVGGLAPRGAGGARLMPDALRLPVPATGAWTVMATGDRILVRCDDGTGFAVSADHFTAAWAASGSPPLTAYGDAWPLDTPAAAGGDLPSFAIAVDLRCGLYAPASPPLARALRRAGVLAAAGLATYALVLAADERALFVRATAARARAEALLRQALPGTPLPADAA
ncbi:MAG: general secretion pathway protein GspL, partial [Sphingomonadaceae bacterium]|nr:general secretion pathway protein GspL [Sphingomonadaceae bacterium]